MQRPRDPPVNAFSAPAAGGRMLFHVRSPKISYPLERRITAEGARPHSHAALFQPIWIQRRHAGRPRPPAVVTTHLCTDSATRASLVGAAGFGRRSDVR